MTLDYYTHVLVDDECAAIEGLPDIDENDSGNIASSDNEMEAPAHNLRFMYPDMYRSSSVCIGEHRLNCQCPSQDLNLQPAD